MARYYRETVIRANTKKLVLWKWQEVSLQDYGLDFKKAGLVRCRPGEGRTRATNVNDDRYIWFTARRDRRNNVTKIL